MTSNSGFTAAVVEDHPMMRASVVRAVELAGGTVVVNSEFSGDAYERIRATRPQLAIIDIQLGEDSGIDLTRRVLEHDRHLGVIIFTGTGDSVSLQDGLDCGARGFVLKTSAAPVLMTALRAVARGGTYVDEAVQSLIATRTDGAPRRVLSDRERQILSLMSNGLTGEDVAAELSLSPETVKTHVRNASRKLSARNRTHAVVIGLRNGELHL